MTSKKSLSKDVITITVDYGYDIHSVGIEPTEYERIFRGDVIRVKGCGFSIEGNMESDEWTFNKEAPGSVYVTTENLHDVYIGSMGDGNITFEPDPHGLNFGPKYSSESWAEAQAWERHRRPNPNIRNVKKPNEK